MGMTSHKPPLASKKLWAYLLAEVSWTGLLGYSIAKDTNATVLLTMIVTKGFLQTAYILGQAYVDKYTSAIEHVIDNAIPDRPPKD